VTGNKGKFFFMEGSASLNVQKRCLAFAFISMKRLRSHRFSFFLFSFLVSTILKIFVVAFNFRWMASSSSSLRKQVLLDL